MGRPLRRDVDGAWYHVVNRGAGRGTIFFDDRDRVEFERLLGVAHERFGVNVHAYCWMTNHYHLLLECPFGDLTGAMHILGSLYVRHVNDRLGRDGPLFRDRFFAKQVDSDEYLLRVVRYIHRNPLAFLPAHDLSRYRWSSLRAFAGDRHPPRWLRVNDILAMCGGSEGFHQLVFDDEPADLDPIGVSWLLALVDLAIDELEPESRSSHSNRAVAVALLDRVDPHQRAALVERLGYPTPQAVRSARSRSRKRLSAQPALYDVVERVLHLAA